MTKLRDFMLEFKPITDDEILNMELGFARWVAEDSPEYKAFNTSDYKDEARCFSELFFKGGKLAWHGFQLKPEIKEQGGWRLIGWLMNDMRPSHGAKEATVCYALRSWCNRIPPVPRELEDVTALDKSIKSLPVEKVRTRKKPKKSYRIRKVQP